MPQTQIDHVVVLVPYADLLTPPRWVTDNFTLTPGGRHSDGRTENKLIIFSDGTYLELIAFINDDPAHRLNHPWGTKPFGFIDFALTTPTPSLDIAALRARIAASGDSAGGLGIEYHDAVPGGRTRDDGVSVRWTVSVPTAGRRGEVPFWCHDVTARTDRVDMAAAAVAAVAANTTHPSGVKGIAQFTILVPDGTMDAYVDVYSSIVDTSPVRVFGTARLLLETPVRVPGLVKPWLFVESPTLDVERRRLQERGPGIVEIALRLGVEGEVGPGRASIDEMGVWIHFLR